MPLYDCQRIAEHFGLGTRHALRESRERGDPVPGLVERRQHQLRHVRLPGRGRPVPPGATVPFPAREPLLRKPVKHRHDGGVSQVALIEPVADLSDRQRRIRLPEDFHDGTFEVAQPVHMVSIPLKRFP